MRKQVTTLPYVTNKKITNVIFYKFYHLNFIEMKLQHCELVKGAKKIKKNSEKT